MSLTSDLIDGKIIFPTEQHAKCAQKLKHEFLCIFLFGLFNDIDKLLGHVVFYSLRLKNQLFLRIKEPDW